jgi:hypothetical protein
MSVPRPAPAEPLARFTQLIQGYRVRGGLASVRRGWQGPGFILSLSTTHPIRRIGRICSIQVHPVHQVHRVNEETPRRVLVELSADGPDYTLAAAEARRLEALSAAGRLERSGRGDRFSPYRYGVADPAP